jgi:hypothetical protein
MLIILLAKRERQVSKKDFIDEKGKHSWNY